MRPTKAVATAAAIVFVLLLAVPMLAGLARTPDNRWAAQATQLDQLRRDGATAQRIRVAILDSGIDLDHPSLVHLGDGREGDGELVGYADFIGSSLGPQDRGGHGTYVAGVLAASPPDGLASLLSAGSRLHGLAPQVDLLVGRVCQKDVCNLLSVWQGLEWAIENDADVVSLSLGYTSAALEDHELIVERFRQTLRRAETEGVLVVAAAGNTDGAVVFPAREPTVLAVGAMDRDHQPRPSSARGYGSEKPDLVAPGQDIVGLARHDGRVAHDGTSAAVPFVVAAATLMMAGGSDPQDARQLGLLRKALLDTAEPLDGQRVPHDPWAGHGLLQAEAALRFYQVLLAVQPEDPGQERTRATTPSPMADGPVAGAWSTTSSSLVPARPVARPPSTRPAAT